MAFHLRVAQWSQVKQLKNPSIVNARDDMLPRVLCIFITLFFVGCNVAFAKPKHTNYNPLRLRTLLLNVDKNFPQIKIARLRIQQTKGELTRSLGSFDPSLSTETRSSPIGGYVSEYVDSSINVPTLMNGLQFFGGYRNGQGDWPVYWQNYLTNSKGEYRAGFSLPIFRNRQIDKQRTDLWTQAKRIAVNKRELGVTKLTVFQGAITAYWQWIQAGRQYKAFCRLLSLANKRQKAINISMQAGAMSQLVMVENKQQIMQRKQLVNQSKMVLKQTARNLSIYYRDTNGRPIIPTIHQLPKDESGSEKKYISNAQVIENINKHPGLRRLDEYAKIVKLNRDLAKNDLEPLLDISASTSKQYGINGYPLLLPQAALIGINFKFPMFQREAKGRLIAANSELKQVLNEKRLLYDQLKIRLSNLLIAKDTLKKQLTYIRQELKFASQVAHGENSKFYAGDSSLFLVNQREQTVTQVELNLIAADISLAQTISTIDFFISTNALKTPTVIEKSKTHTIFPLPFKMRDKLNI
ncbi:MAG: hypothetical protein A3F18_06140 [Legionellales bacterium RIFCSPHIGHO2_12_FULL_37_14]|nr:MAG: hypothetical protein A3F18_06140 [Legionellales bacterium RIFCSPHIGHO2_12_FULL_37_14]